MWSDEGGNALFSLWTEIGTRPELIWKQSIWALDSAIRQSADVRCAGTSPLKWLQRVTDGYSRLQRLQRVTAGYRGGGRGRSGTPTSTCNYVAFHRFDDLIAGRGARRKLRDPQVGVAPRR